MIDQDDEYDDGPLDECDHLEYEVDILTGQATCVHCRHRWYETEAEQKLRERAQAEWDRQCAEWGRQEDARKGQEQEK